MSVFTDDGWRVADRDEFLRPDTTLEALAGLRTPFRAGRPRHRRATPPGSPTARPRASSPSEEAADGARARADACASSASPTRASSRS